MKLSDVLDAARIGQTGGPGQGGQNEPSLAGRLQDLETVLSVIRKINTTLVLSDVLALVVDHAVRITHADRGFIMLAGADGALRYVTGHDGSGATIPAESFEVSQSVLDDVYSTGESLCVEDALNDERFEQRQSIVDLALKTIMCAPLRTHERTIGVIYVDSRHIHAVNKDEILRLFEILAGQAAIAIKNARLYEDLKQTFDELRSANDYIIRSEKMAMRGEMAAEVSHELKNILGVMLLQAQCLQTSIKRTNAEDTDRFIKGLILSIQKINKFSENLLIRADVSAQMKPVQVNELMRNFTSFIKVLPKYRDGRIELVLGENIPDVSADSDQLQQILLNLANNAIEARRDSTITFTTEYDLMNNVVRFTVGDDGPGLDPRVKEKMFVEKITTKPSGHGFGLPVCRKIVQNHGGEIRAESEAGQGTKFIIALPGLM
jgi:signal transduction histidine kinase